MNPSFNPIPRLPRESLDPGSHADARDHYAAMAGSVARTLNGHRAVAHADPTVAPLRPRAPSRTPRVTVKMATTEKEKEAIYRLRYQVYIEEMNGRDRHLEADVSRRQLRDEWDDRAHHFYVSQDGLVVSCARVILRRDGRIECEGEFELEQFTPAFPNRVAMTSRLVSHPERRGRHLLKQLMCAMYRFVREQGIQFTFIDCHTKLLPLYSRLGFRAYRPGFNHAQYTYVVPMVLVIDDVDHLEQVKSPFLAVAREFPASVLGRDLLLSRFPNHPSTQALRCRSGAFSIETLLVRLLDSTAHSEQSEMLEGLTLEDVKLLASLGHLVRCQIGDAVLRSGDPGREIFLILEGSFQVRGRICPAKETEVEVSKRLIVGDVFGEIRFLTEEIRYASVVALDHSTVLVLNAKAMDRLVITAPKVAAKVFRNIARIVINRLCHTVGVPSQE